MNSYTNRLVLAGLLTISLAMAASAQDMTQADLHECADLVGTWSSGEYEALSVQSSGPSTEIGGLEMVLSVEGQHGCHFFGVNQWTNGQIGGEEPVIGVLNPIGNWITIIESGPHPDGGSSGRIFGRLMDADHITWEYAAYSAGGDRMNVFSTVLSRGETPAVVQKCADLTGEWRSANYDLIETNSAGHIIVRSGRDGILSITRQHACHLDGEVIWRENGAETVERIVGALHEDGKLITILGHGDQSENPIHAYVHAEIVGPDQMSWDFVGLSDDQSSGRAFSTTFTRAQASADRDTCPVLMGTWNSNAWEGLEWIGAGQVERVTRDFKTLRIDGQHGCIVWGETVYGRRSGETKGHTDRILGVINGKDGLLITRSVAPDPEDGYAAIAVHRLQSQTSMVTEYSGEVANGGGTFVYLTDLVLQQ